MMKNKILGIFLSVMLLCSLCTFYANAESNFGASVELNGTTITVSGEGITSVKGIVTVRTDAPDGNIFNINQIKAEADGSFSYSMELLDSDATGTYTVTVSTRASDMKISDTVYYLSRGTKENISDAVNTSEDMVTILSEYKKELGIEDFNDTDITNAAFVLSLSDTAYDFEQIKTIINRSKAVWDGLAECNENTLTGFLKANRDILFASEETFAVYNQFSTVNKQKTNTIVLSETDYSDFTAVRTAVENAVSTVQADIVKRLIYIQGDIKVNVISVSGNGIETARKIVTLKITDKDGNIINLNQITANDDGTFSYSLTLADDDASGSYTVEAFSREIDEIASVSGLYYLNKSDRADVANQIENASDVTEIETILTNNAAYMGLSDLSANDIKSAAIVLKNSVAQDGYNYETIINKIDESKKLMDALNKEDWTTLDSFITANADVLLGGVTEYSKYETIYGVANRNKICKTIMESAPFNNLEEFRKAFADAVKNYNPPLTSLPGGGGGSSSNSGATSSAISGFNQYNTVPTGAQSSGFTDLADHEWARESVEGLLQRGVVAAAADGKYRPSDNVTREEFIKLIVCAFALTDAGAQCSFSDVPYDSWYYVYVASAYKNNITQGISETAFGTGSDIKRQEMASLAYRVIQTMNIEIKSDGEEKVFNDAAYIADYAKEAVSAMQKAGVINGDDTGNFRPDGSATRAEAAKVIYMLLASAGR